MCMELLDLQIARWHIENYASHTRGVAECDCADILQRGIDAVRWLQQAELSISEATTLRLIEFSHDLRLEIEQLYARWLEHCEAAEVRIKAHLDRGFSLDNLEEFREACDEVRGWIEENKWNARVQESREVRFSDEPW